MRVISCIVTEHNLWLVLLAALICVSGGGVALRLLQRASEYNGVQRGAWLFLASVAAGASVWCTHFIAMLAYDAGAPITFDPILTMISLVIAVAGCGYGFTVALLRKPRFAAELGGGAVGLAITAMHYTGMQAYRIDGIVDWDADHVVASIAFSVVFAALALGQAVRHPWKFSGRIALGLFTSAVVLLHFTAMTAVAVTPMSTGMAVTDPGILQAMAVAVAVVGMMVVGTGVVSYVIDSRTSEESYRQLQHMALNDALTGLPNRTSFSSQLDNEIARARESGGRLAVIGIDLDRFKEINDLRGHSAGDQALKIVGRRLTRLLGDGEFIARVGGDEFSAIKRFTEQANLLDFVARLKEALFEPIRIDDFDCATGASIGIAVYPQDGDNQERLVSNADLAMYRAKADVTRAICFYELRMDEASRNRQALARDLRRAIELDQLELHYQVQTSISTGEIRGFEVLLRWTHPERGKVPPSEFIPIAEENGLIMAIGEWVLRTACKQAASWEMPYKIAVNLSPVQFAHPDLASLVLDVLTETGLEAKRLELEITETTIIADKVRTLQTLRRIREFGVTIALDDFGVGYSSLDTLRSFPFDKIKLDRSFMSELEENPQAKAIVRAVLTLGKSLNIPVLAEGVETDDQLTILQTELCDEAQGFFLGRPKPVEQIFVPGGDGGEVDPVSSGRMPLARMARKLVA
jgi:diguanylate cyclase (GGDEF)-like protein